MFDHVDLAIRRADFDDPALALFLTRHLDDLAPTAPKESRHALDIVSLREPSVRMWVGHVDDQLVVTGALVTIAGSNHDEEVKSMRTEPAVRGKGLGMAMLTHLAADARARGVQRLWLETGSMEYFAAARALYRRFGFTECGPFGAYRADPNSTFMTTML